jgi:hypothetical protein
MGFYPQGSQIPTELKTAEFLLRPLRATDVTLDYAAVMDSRSMLRRWGGGRWPADDFTLADNLADLKGHEEEHLAGIAFTFTVMNLAETECLGCVYIDPLIRLHRQSNAGTTDLAAVRDNEAVARFWVRQPQLVHDLDRRLLQALLNWFEEEWAFSRLLFRTNERDERQAQLLLDAGMRQLYALDIPGRTGKYVVYGYDEDTIPIHRR